MCNFGDNEKRVCKGKCNKEKQAVCSVAQMVAKIQENAAKGVGTGTKLEHNN